MDTAQYDKQIETLETKRKEVFAELDDLMGRYILEAVNFVDQRAREFIHRAIERRPEVVQGLGVEKLREAKTALDRFIGEFPVSVPERLSKDQLWEHRQPLPEVISFEFSRNAGKKTEGEMRSILGGIGEVLLKYGLATEGSHQEWGRDASGNLKYNFGFTDRESHLPRIMGDYRKQIEHLGENEEAFQSAIARREQALAKKLWDNA